MRMKDRSCPLIRKNGSSCVGSSWRRNAEKTSTSFLDARGSSFFFTEITSSWFLKVCEKFVTGHELSFVIMNFIHKARCFSGFHNVRCVLWICNWLNRNFYSISVKNFHNVNFLNWSNGCAFKNCCQRLSFSDKIGEVNVLGTEE